MIAILNRLAMFVASTGPLDPTPQDPDEIRTAACRLVATKAECAPATPKPLPSPSAPNLDAGGITVLDLLLKLVLIAGVGALLYLLFRLALNRWPSLRRRAAAPDDDEVDPDDDHLVGTVIIDRSREPKSWRQLADEHRAKAEFREALRCRYRALVGDLARRGLLDEIPGRTTGGERRQLKASNPEVAVAFGEAADIFDDAWFGHLSADIAHDDRLRVLDADVLRRATNLAHRVPRAYDAYGLAGADDANDANDASHQSQLV